MSRKKTNKKHKKSKKDNSDISGEEDRKDPKTESNSAKKYNNTSDEVDENYVPLSDLVIKLKNVVQHKYKDKYFQEILERIDPLVKKISYKYNVSGHDNSDIYQEALFALRFKAIRDFDIERTNEGDVVCFEKFAALCIKRHLSTLLKTSFQNKQYTLNSSVSMNADKKTDSGDETGSLSDILSGDFEEDLDRMIKEEQFSLIISELMKVLSSFEKKVLLLYAQRYSYKEIADIINENREKVKINIKGVDNALSRIKIKAKTLLDKLNEDFDEPIYTY